jgi:GNAT superfamily N-acetyltransferase
MTLQLMPATMRDTDFILSLILFGAHKGHFYPDLANNKSALRAILDSTIKYGVQDASGLRSQAMVGWHNGVRVGATIVSDTEKTDNSIELSVIAVRKEHQGRKYGAQLLDALLRQWLPHKTIYVRCFPASEQLVQMLLRRGFILAGTTGKHTRVLRRQQEIQPVWTSGDRERFCSQSGG